jgi:hypothetical protein
VEVLSGRRTGLGFPIPGRNDAPSAPWVSRERPASAKLASGVPFGRVITQEQKMPIDLSTVNWLYVVIMGVFVFVAAVIGNLIALGSRVGGALITAILFAAMYVAWNYYPHPQIQLPIVTTYSYPSNG